MAYSDTQTRSTIAAYFATQSAAHAAVAELRQAGFNADQVGIAGKFSDTGLAGGVGSEFSTHVKTAGDSHESTWTKIKSFFEGGNIEPYADEKRRGDVESHEITPEGGFDTRGYAEDGYDARDVRGSLSSLSVPEQHSRYFGHRLGSGEEGAVVTVQPNGREAEAEEILVNNGGDLGSDSDGYAFDEALEDETAQPQRIQLLGEVLRVHKERISSGEVRLRKEVITEQQTIQVPVMHEELVIERIAGNSLTPVSGTIGADSDIRIPLTQEVASVDKQTVVREEVGVAKKTIEGVQSIDSGVQHEELRIEEGNGIERKR